MKKHAATSCIIGMLFIYHSDVAVASDSLAIYFDVSESSKQFLGVSYETIQTGALGFGGIAAILTLILTVKNVMTSKKQQRASVLFDLDVRWESQSLKAPKKDAYDMLTTAMGKAESPYGTAEFEKEVSQRLKEELDEIYIHNKEKHDGLMYILSFLETIGHASRNGYIPHEDIFDLFGGSILWMRILFKTHIDEMQDQDSNIYFNTAWLFEKCKKKLSRQALTRQLKCKFFPSLCPRQDSSQETG